MVSLYEQLRDSYRKWYCGKNRGWPRDTACTAKYHEVPQQEYDGSQYALDFNFLEEEQKEEEEEVEDVAKMPATAAAPNQILATGTGRTSTMNDNVFKELEVAPTHLKVN
jgi:hypothetical protein